MALAWWLVLFGIWPFADPGHSSLEPMVVADLLLHALAAGWLWFRFLEGRRQVAAALRAISAHHREDRP